MPRDAAVRDDMQLEEAMEELSGRISQLEEANQIASALKQHSYGVVPSKRGWAVRIMKSKVADLTSTITLCAPKSSGRR